MPIVDKSIVNSRSTIVKKGYSLIEVLMALFFVTTFATILLTSSRTLFTTRNEKLQTYAAHAVSKDIENLRNTAFDSLPGSTGGSCETVPAEIQSDLTNLGSSACLKRTVTAYDTSNPSNIKKFTITVTWNRDGGVQAKPITFDTLIYRNGL